MQKANIDVHIWNELRSNDRLGFNMSETYPRKNLCETLFAGHTPSSVGFDCKITNYFSFLQIKKPLMSKKHKWQCNILYVVHRIYGARILRQVAENLGDGFYFFCEQH